ncbi:hypothetical protein EIN_400730 [Entamoeba invadens IP1]|uniref:PH domain-containing protein n=1 Tax=Entamoeba invadens IP1 TaxID=370355 RepID=A0A0A1UA81_ENTIV|nr:hypothetical protein EIN_400730 [Entamoeba invadens IP1]ELP91953.1 hypothetical protein EIN_400730 [Entamoeba invadens IP1]|eukprot:XP_004258724.1 hypothetical protein EIN_400730 [Entamoeba invadens IP1]
MSDDLNVSVQSLQPSLFEAWAKKQGGSVKSWKKRWFVLKPNKLWYFTSKSATTATGYIELNSTTQVEEEPTMNVPGKKFFFSVLSRNQKGDRKFILFVETEMYLHEFVKRMKDVILAQQKSVPKSVPQQQIVEEQMLTPVSINVDKETFHPIEQKVDVTSEVKTQFMKKEEPPQTLPTQQDELPPTEPPHLDQQQQQPSPNDGQHPPTDKKQFERPNKPAPSATSRPKKGWVVTRPTLSMSNGQGAQAAIQQQNAQMTTEGTTLNNQNVPTTTVQMDDQHIASAQATAEATAKMQQELEEIRQREEEKRLAKFRQQQEEYKKQQAEEEKRRADIEEAERQSQLKKEEEQRAKDQAEMLRQQQELFKQQELQRKMEEEEAQKAAQESAGVAAVQNGKGPMARGDGVAVPNDTAPMTQCDGVEERSEDDSEEEKVEGEDLTLQNVIAFVQAFEWIDENAQEFVQLFYDNIPRSSPTNITGSVNPSGNEIVLRCTSPVDSLKEVVEFFNQVGSPTTEIGKLESQAKRVGVLAIETWISLSEKGGCDAGWGIIAEQDTLDIIKEISDISEIDSVGIIKLWCETNGVDFVHRFGRDMGDQPPYNTEFSMDVNANDKEMIQNAAVAFMFPDVPTDVVECAEENTMVKVVTSEEGFVKFSVIVDKAKEEQIKKCIEARGEDPTNVLNLKDLLSINIVGMEYTYLNDGFGYDVYQEGEKITVQFRLGCF